MNWQIEV